ncbi:diguanylate cyclase [Endozoicomonas sp. SM1973]|uniref:diguanylate cyclase n=1 Tax=Spartinivicinus marinus TaxID=2994442 RepID=A0A853IED9_9GAMM|nr:diguanylate cyclase [Spartinivicinus marinus]MCX4029266.1 diguanylate cyclase [Spartinivicinus marinus]NYZ65826.1 diguanylate cyclase [Spartinivicinus marinus]
MNLGLRQKIATTILVVTVVLLLISGSLYYINSQQALTQAIKHHLATTLTIQAARLNQVIQQHQERLALLTSRTQLRLSLRDHLEVPNPAALAKVTKILIDAKKAIPDFRGIMVLSLQGDVLAATEPALLDSDFTDLHLPTPTPQMWVRVVVTPQNQKQLHIVSPLVLENKELGQLVVIAGLESIQAIVTGLIGLGLSEETIISYQTAEGQVESILPVRFANQLQPFQLKINPFKLITAGQAPELLELTDYQGHQVFAYVTTFSKTGWGMTLKIDQDEALAPLARQRHFMIIALLVSAFVTILFAVFLATSITRPINSLTHVAVMIANGDLSQRIHSFTNDELGVLARAFNQMADKLIAANELLEERVRNKTRDLAETNEKLLLANSQLERISRLDGLTEIANRRAFDQVLAQEWSRCQREEKRLALILLDVDLFKNYNDMLGHLAGDQCLKQIAKEIESTCQRPGDLTARYGGEEFVVLLPNTDSAHAHLVANKIQEQIKALVIAHPKSATGYVTLSMGIAACIPSRELQPADLIDQADQALYQAKQQGRNQIVEYTPADD